MKSYLKYLKIIAVIFVLVLVAEVWMVNRLATFGSKLQDLKEEQVTVSLQNQILQNQIAEYVSLVTIDQRAKSLGFDTTLNLDYHLSKSIASLH
ncbi:MAG: hypothetical protein Q7S88_01940 [Candidatus Daviesbacteria bacterium]|nr:hypothetical protein [Candidatus Daviesbacteria bacterium]